MDADERHGLTSSSACIRNAYFLQNENKVNFETFFKEAKLHPNAHLIKGVICGYRIEEIVDAIIDEGRFVSEVGAPGFLGFTRR